MQPTRHYSRCAANTMVNMIAHFLKEFIIGPVRIHTCKLAKETAVSESCQRNDQRATGAQKESSIPLEEFKRALFGGGHLT